MNSAVVVGLTWDIENSLEISETVAVALPLEYWATRMLMKDFVLA